MPAARTLAAAGSAPVLPTLDGARAAADRLRGIAQRTLLVRLNHESVCPIFLKLENLQPVGSFKIRCGANALLSRSSAERGRGFATASAGNFAQGLAYAGRELGVTVTAVVPETAAKSKLEGLRALGARIIVRSYAEWWKLIQDPPDSFDGKTFVHPVTDPAVIEGNATIGLEILADLPDVETVIVPYGGGGLATGVAAALKSCRPSVQVLGCETEAGRPLAAAFAAGEPREVPFDSTTFVTGMGASRVLEVMWPLVRRLMDGAIAVSLAETADAIRLLMLRHHVIAEGAGGAPVAAAMKGVAGAGPIVCIVSGGHLDPEHIMAILAGRTPGSRS